MAIRYESCVRAGNKMRDGGFCGVIALATALQIPFKKAFYLLEAKGRKKGKGSSPQAMFEIIEELGFKVEIIQCKRNLHYRGDDRKFLKLDEQYDDRIKTVITAQKHLPKTGKYICFVGSHVLTIRNGNVEDWSEGRKNQIVMIWKVTK